MSGNALHDLGPTAHDIAVRAWDDTRFENHAVRSTLGWLAADAGWDSTAWLGTE